MFTTIFFILFGFGCHHKKIDNTPSTIQYTTESQVKAFLYEAFLLGLQEDNVSLKMAENIRDSNILVPKCPICTNTKRAVDSYKGPKLLKKQNVPVEIITGMNGTRKEKMEALKQLASRYIQRHIQKLAVQGEARQNLEQQLKNMRDKGMKTKPKNFGDFCPSCEGVLL